MTAARQQKTARKRDDNVVHLDVRTATVPEYVDVTPTLARQWLAINAINRDVRPGDVTRYATDMRNGHWAQTGEAIKFSRSGNLIDGQHRLLAIDQANTTVRLLVVPGLDDDAQTYMDQGAQRSPGDALKFHGYTYAGMLAALARLGVLVDRDALFRDTARQRVSVSDLLDWLAHNPSAEDAAAWVSTTFGKSVPLRPSVQAYTYLRTHDVDATAAHLFFDHLADGHGLERGSPLLALRSRIQRAERKNETIPRAHLLLAVYRTWNAWREGREMATLAIDRNGTRTLPDLA